MASRRSSNIRKSKSSDAQQSLFDFAAEADRPGDHDNLHQEIQDHQTASAITPHGPTDPLRCEYGGYRLAPHLETLHAPLGDALAAEVAPQHGPDAGENSVETESSTTAQTSAVTEAKAHTEAKPHTEGRSITEVRAMDAGNPSVASRASVDEEPVISQSAAMLQQLHQRLAELTAGPGVWAEQSDEAMGRSQSAKVNSLTDETPHRPASRKKTDIAPRVTAAGIGHQMILASAGTGKTFQLSNRYIKLLALGHDPRQILASTFTRKAAGEILERIVLRLADAATSDTEAEKLSGFIDQALSTRDFQNLLRRLVRSLNTLQIGTLDSFFSQIARSFCFELELPQNWSIVSEQEETRIQNQAINLVLEQENVLELLHLIAKGETTRGLSSQMRNAVQDAYTLFQLSVAQAWEIPGAKSNLPDFDLEQWIAMLPEIETQHGVKGEKCFQELIETIANQHWDRLQKNTMFKNVAAGNPKYNRKAILPAAVDVIQLLASNVKDLFIAQLNRRNSGTYQLLEIFDQFYRRLKSISGDLRFDNVQNRLARWVGSLPDPAQKMVARLDFPIEHLLLDEFQDTVPQQWKILYPIAQSIVHAMPSTDHESATPSVATSAADKAKSASTSSLFCVGDQKQAIYRFRGGDSRIFDTLRQEFPSIQQTAMNTSYRSSPVVLDVVNRVFENLSSHPSSDNWEGLAQKWQSAFEPHQASAENANLSGFAELVQVETETTALLEQAAQKVASLYHETENYSIGLLVPTNDQVGQVLGYLSRLKIPASEESGNRLSDSAAIGLLISVLQVIDHPGDTASWFHILTGPSAPDWFAHLSPPEIQSAIHSFRPKAASDSHKSQIIGSDGATSDPATSHQTPAHQTPSGEHALPPAIQTMLSSDADTDDQADAESRSAFAEAAPDRQRSVYQVWQQLYQWTHQQRAAILANGYGPVLTQWCQSLEKFGSHRDRKRLKQVITEAFNYDNPLPLRTSEFARLLAQIKRHDPTSARVRVMNVHQCKGLEFDMVVLSGLETLLTSKIDRPVIAYQPDLAQPPEIVCRYTNASNWEMLPSNFQDMFRMHRREHFNERLCQLYVGLTRAKRALHVVVARPKGKCPQSPAGIVINALAGERDLGEHAQITSQVLFESGQRDWAIIESKTAGLKAPQESKANTMDSLADGDGNKSAALNNRPAGQGQSILKLAPPLPVSTRGIPRSSPSSLEGGATFALGSLLQSRERQEAFLRGQIFHAWFEWIQWLDVEPTPVQMAERALEIERDRERWEPWVDEFLLAIKQPNVRRLLQQDFYLCPQANDFPRSVLLEMNRQLLPNSNRAGVTLPSDADQQRLPLSLIVQNERPFAVFSEGKLLNGFIDRLVLSFSPLEPGQKPGQKVVAADIIDFKTDRFNDPGSAKEINDRVENYRPQLEAYRRAVARLTQLSPEFITARLMFLSIDHMVNIFHLDDSA